MTEPVNCNCPSQELCPVTKPVMQHHNIFINELQELQVYDSEK